MGFDGLNCWMIQPGKRSVHAATFVERDIASIGWDLDGIGDLDVVSDADVFLTLQALGRRKPEDDVRDLRMFTTRIADGDVVVMRDGAAGDLVFGTAAGPYRFNPAAGEHRHSRPIAWFGRVATRHVDDTILNAFTDKAPVRHLPEQIHYQRLAGEVKDYLGRDPRDIPVTAKAVRASAAKVARGTAKKKAAAAAAKPEKVLVPDRLCPACGLLRSPSMFLPDGDGYCRDCA